MERKPWGTIRGGDQLEIWFGMLDIKVRYSYMGVIWVLLKSWKKLKTPNLKKKTPPALSSGSFRKSDENRYF